MLATQSRTDIILGLGQMRAAAGEGTVLVCLGLGSCVAFVAYDPATKIGGMAHMVLPYHSESATQQPSPKFVDCAIPMLLEEMRGLGAEASRPVIKLVGGAHMIRTPGKSALLNIGDRNVESAKRMLAQLHLPLAVEDTGGASGRTARLDLGSGRLVVASAGEPGHEI